MCRTAVHSGPLDPTAPGVIVHGEPGQGTGHDDAVLTSDDMRDEGLFQETSAIVRSPDASTSRPGLILLLSLGAFVLLRKPNRPALELGILIGVLFLHEAGHWLGMQCFGYRNVKMFFLPFFGAAVSGKKEGAPQWQEAIVLLLGPLPGLLLGTGLYIWHLVSPEPVLAQIAIFLVAINAFNLLPLEPLDGGRLLNILIFSRHHALESTFLAVTSLLVLGLGLWGGLWLLAALGGFGLCSVPARYRTARLASVVRRRWPVLPPRIADAPEPVLRDVFHELKRSFPGQTVAKAQAVALAMRSVYERSLVRPISLLGTLPLLATYCGGILLFFFVCVLHFAFGGIRGVGPHA